MRAEKLGQMISMGLLAMGGLQLAGAQAEGPNLIQNPGFESNQDWWGFDQSFGTATGTITFDDPMAVHGGAKGAKIEVTAVDGENWHIQLQCPPQFEAAKDVEYHLSFWSRTNSEAGKSIHVAIQDGAPEFAYRAGENFSLDTTWRKIEKVWLSDVEGLEALRFNIYLGSDTGTYYFDDFSLVAVSVPTGLERPKRSIAMPPGNTVTIPVVDAAGRSIRIGESRGRKGIVFSP